MPQEAIEAGRGRAPAAAPQGPKADDSLSSAPAQAPGWPARRSVVDGAGEHWAMPTGELGRPQRVG
eukprot:1527369-Prorocentrum_lima.AAC.1